MSFESALIPTDLSEYSLSIEHCVHFYARLGIGKAFLFHVYDESSGGRVGPLFERLKAFAHSIQASGIRVEYALERGEDPASSILAKAREVPTDLMIMGSHGKGFLKRFLLGSVSQRVLTHWNGSILIERLPFDKIGTGELRQSCELRLTNIVMASRKHLPQSPGYRILHRLAKDGLHRMELFTTLEISDLLKPHILDRIPEMRSRAMRSMENVATGLSRMGALVTVEVGVDPIASSLVHRARKMGAGLVILELQDPDDPWQDSVERLVVHLPCSTLVIRQFPATQ